MRPCRTSALRGAIVGLLGLGAISTYAGSLLAPTDLVKAIDTDVLTPASSYPGGETPPGVIDGNAGGTKYLNFGGRGTGFIVTPTSSAAVRSFLLTTGGDADGRDPFSYALFGRNGAISSTDNSTGTAESWTFIQQGTLNPPAGDAGRNQPFPAVNVNNNTSYSSYKIYFPTLRNRFDPNMQINEAQFYTGANLTGSPIFAPGNPILAIDAPVSESLYPDGENPHNAVDGDPNTKYLNFGQAHSGLIVTPGGGRSIVTGIKVTSANDTDGRDPIAFSIYGTDAAITGIDNSDGSDDAWALIASGSLATPTDRLAESPLATFANGTAYNSYKIVFTDIRTPGGDGVDSMQVGEVQLDGTFVPEPSAMALGGAAVAGLAMRRRRSR